MPRLYGGAAAALGAASASASASSARAQTAHSVGNIRSILSRAVSLKLYPAEVQQAKDNIKTMPLESLLSECQTVEEVRTVLDNHPEAGHEKGRMHDVIVAIADKAVPEGYVLPEKFKVFDLVREQFGGVAGIDQYCALWSVFRQPIDESDDIADRLAGFINPTYIEFYESYGHIIDELNGPGYDMKHQLKLLPPGIGKCAYLTKLDVSGHALLALPSDIGKCQALVELNVADNGYDFTQLPDSLAECRALYRVNLRNNNLSALPKDLRAKKIEVTGNPDLPIRATDEVEGLDARGLASKHLEKVMAWLRDNAVMPDMPLPADKNDLLKEQFGSTQRMQYDRLCMALNVKSLGEVTPGLLAEKLRGFINPAYLEMRDYLDRVDGATTKVDSSTPTVIIPDNYELILMPPGLGQLKQLEDLNLNNYALLTLPFDLAECNALRVLSVANNQIAVLPDMIGAFVNLRSLMVQGNGLAHISDEIDQCTELEWLYAGENGLEALPDTLGQCRQLKILDVCDNLLAALPESIARCRQLTELNVSNNHLAALPEYLPHLTKLQALDVSGNGLDELPRNMNALSVLKELNLSWNNFTGTCPEDLGLMKSLQVLDISNNQMSTLPPDFAFQTLTALYVQNNKLTSLLPRSLGDLTVLQVLDAGGNKGITALPATIGKLGDLEYLNVSSCAIRQLPTTIGDCRNLTEILAGNNAITVLPPSVQRLTALEVLDVANNQLRTLPDLTGCTALESVWVEGNPRMPRRYDVASQVPDGCQINPVDVE